MVINSSEGTSITLPAEIITVSDFITSETEPAVSKADTSGMDFSFDESNKTAETTSSGTMADVSGNTTTASSSTELYNITSGGTYTFSGTITDTMITVDANNADVTIILNGASIKNSLCISAHILVLCTVRGSV